MTPGTLPQLKTRADRATRDTCSLCILMHRLVLSPGDLKLGSQMPYTYRVSPEERLVYVSGEGEVELAESKETLLSIVASAPSPSGFGLVFDLRNVTSTPYAETVHEIAAFLTVHFPGSPGFAIVVSGPDHYGLATTASLDIEGKGLLAGAFEDPVAAVGWLKSLISPIESV